MAAFAARWGPALAVMAAIFAASAQTSADLPDFGAWDFFAKKGGHLVGYALLGAAYLRGLAWRRPVTAAAAALAIVLAALYGAADERHQAFVEGRTPSPLDVLVDAVGAAAGVALAAGIRRARRLERRP